MQSSVRANLENSIHYHATLADYHAKQEEESKQASDQPQPGQQPEQQPPPQPMPEEQPYEQEQPEEQPEEERAAKSAHQRLAEMHADVAQQLRDLLDADPPMPSMAEKRDARPVTRSLVRSSAREAARTGVRRATIH